jgi:hypothetical protein
LKKLIAIFLRTIWKSKEIAGPQVRTTQFDIWTMNFFIFTDVLRFWVFWHNKKIDIGRLEFEVTLFYGFMSDTLSHAHKCSKSGYSTVITLRNEEFEA